VRPGLLGNATSETELKEHCAPLGLGVSKNGDFYKYFVPTGLGAMSVLRDEGTPGI